MRLRKRTIIAIFATILTLALLNKSWFVFVPLPLDFCIKGDGKYNIEAQLNKKDNDKFNKIKSQTIDIDLNKDNHASFNINRSKFPKRLRIIFTNHGKISPIEISDINFKHGKYKLDLDGFKADNGKLTVKDNKLIIEPKFNSVKLVYDKTLNVRCSIKFDFRIFVIILVLSFLLFYKLSDYIADFKTDKDKSRIDIIFLTVFFIFLFIPMSRINQNEISENENRMLEKWHPLINNEGEINYNFPKHFNSWFNDRFNLRETFIDNYTKTSIAITGKTQKGIVDKSGFLYLDYEFDHSFLLSQIEDADYKALVQFNDFCKQNNIDLYVLIIPDKAYIYPPSKKILAKDEYLRDINKKVAELNKKYDMHIIIPTENLKKGAEKQYVFFKTEHHWTDDGAFIGYKELMKEISNKHKNVKILNENDFNYSYNTMVRADWARTYDFGTTSYRINLPKHTIKKLHKTNYRYYTHKDEKMLQTGVTDIPYHKNKVYFYPKGADYRVILLGTSQSENLTEFIPYTFKNVRRIRNNNVIDVPYEYSFKIMKYNKDEILNYKPDILIFCITTENMFELRNLFTME